MKNRIQYLILCLIVLLIIKPAYSDEGMWVPLFLKELNEDEMKAMGMKLSADDIYNINKASMKDGVVLFGRGCTGEIVSNSGLMLTNHHCGYGRIQSHSTVDNDLLTNGFWAKNLREELPNQGLNAALLVYMEDVTEEILKDVSDNLTGQLRELKINENIKNLQNKITQDNHYTARVVPFYFGNQYIVMVYEVFKDIRLVGAPPSYIGKFGGDTDNWMWPRHTGDFAWFRIYADKDNNPAEYSEDNVPYTPKYSFPISLKGVEEGDFTFVFGYPGRTNQFATSHAVKMITTDENPIAIEMRRKKMDVMEKYMAKDKLAKIQFAAKHASTANFWKKMIGENKGIKKIDGIGKKQKLEERFLEWVTQDDERLKKYGNLISEFESLYEKLTPANKAATIFFEGGYAIELIRCALQFNRLYEMSVMDNVDENAVKTEVEKLKEFIEGFYKDYDVNADREIASLLLPYYYMVNSEYAPDIFTTIDKKFKSDMQAYVTFVFTRSMFADYNKVYSFLDKYQPSKHAKNLASDEGFRLMKQLVENYRTVLAVTDEIETKLDSLYKIYVVGLMEMNQDKRFYPDANSTLRVSYGNVAPYRPVDAVSYKYYTTTAGILDKSKQDYPDYVISDEFAEFLQNGDFGRYAHSDGTMRVGFIATNHTTGGNSGSPVLNAHGHLVGINFDRVWEGTMSDLFYDIEVCRNISVDIRYVLMITDKYAGAGNLIDELQIVE
jgi:cytochrome c1